MGEGGRLRFRLLVVAVTAEELVVDAAAAAEVGREDVGGSK